MNKPTWTIRLGETSGLASRDSGETATLEGDTLEAIQRLTLNLHTDMGKPTATALASIAEARRVRPGPGARPPTNDAATTDPDAETIPLGPHVRTLDRAFGEVLARRQSERRFQPLELDDIATVLFHGARIRGWHESDDGYQMTSRPAPSAGARHPYELLVAVEEVATVTPGLWRFDAATCSLIREAADEDTLQQALDAVNAATGLTKNAPATIFLVAYFARTLSRYPAGSTLVWRDLGAAASTLHLVASAAGLASCIVGTGGVLEFDESHLRADGIALVMGRSRRNKSDSRSQRARSERVA